MGALGIDFDELIFKFYKQSIKEEIDFLINGHELLGGRKEVLDVEKLTDDDLKAFARARADSSEE